MIKKVIKKIPFVKNIFNEIDKLEMELKSFKEQTAFPPGHFYSPIPSIEEIKEKEIFDKFPEEIPGINLNKKRQFELLNQFESYYKDQPFQAKKSKAQRYFFDNSSYSYGDAIFLYCMVRYLRPKRIIEIGSGFSSCVILDTNELFFNNSIDCTFIDPYPERFLSLIKDSDKGRINLFPQKVQDIDVKLLPELSENDILFIDSSHVSKINSDVNYIFFEILPSLQKGVYIHFHDIHYPFEYPKELIYKRIAWNEAYLLKAFLQFNNAFEIQLFSAYLFHINKSKLEKFPLFFKLPGANLWIKKIL